MQKQKCSLVWKPEIEGREKTSGLVQTLQRFNEYKDIKMQLVDALRQF